MAGNVGVQSSAIVVQGLANDLIKGSVLKRLVKEVSLTVLNGIILSLLIIGFGQIVNQPIEMSLTISVSMIFVIIVAALIGTAVPIILDKLDIDPAIATGPFITTGNDVIGILLFFYTAKIILGFKTMKILHLDSNHDMIYEELSALGIENHVDLKSTKSEIENIISNYHGIVLRSRITIDKGFIEKAINLKFIARVGSGTENIDCEYLKEKKIELISSGEGNSNAVGEHALGLLLSLSKKITKSNIEMKNGLRKREENRGFEIEGKTIGLIGYGKTGKSFAKKLSGFNCNIIFIDIKKKFRR